MDFFSLKDKFILEYPNYKNDIDNFLNYMRNEGGWNLPAQQKQMIRAMRTADIIKSLKHYVNIKQIKKQKPARKYFISIKQFFEFVIDYGEYSNESLLLEFREGIYNAEVSKFIEENEFLLPKESLPALNEEQIKQLIKWCDKNFEKDFSRNPEKKPTFYKRITACLCIKLMILTGVSYSELRKIETRNLNNDESTIIINEYKIRLSKKLSTQLEQYYCLKNENSWLKSYYLFSDYNGKQLGEKTPDSGIPSFIKTAMNKITPSTEVGTTSITSIIKYTINQLIKNDINDSVIMDLTGVNKEIIADCLDNMNGDDREQYINSKLANISTYYLL